MILFRCFFPLSLKWNDCCFDFVCITCVLWCVKWKPKTAKATNKRWTTPNRRRNTAQKKIKTKKHKRNNQQQQQIGPWNEIISVSMSRIAFIFVVYVDRFSIFILYWTWRFFMLRMEQHHQPPPADQKQNKNKTKIKHQQQQQQPSSRQFIAFHIFNVSCVFLFLIHIFSVSVSKYCFSSPFQYGFKHHLIEEVEEVELDHVSQVIGYHPSYLSHFLKIQNFIMRGNGMYTITGWSDLSATASQTTTTQQQKNNGKIIEDKVWY